MQKATGAEILCQVLERSNIRDVFSLPGVENLALFAALKKSAVKTVVPLSELNASFMVNGYARSGAGPAVLITIGGPGFTHALSGIAEASADSAAVLFLVCGFGGAARSFSLHDIDHKSIVSSLVRHYEEVDSADKMENVLSRALTACQSHEPGPVCVFVSSKALESFTRFSQINSGIVPCAEPAPEQVKEIGSALAAAKKPVLFVGQGAVPARHELLALARRLSCPVVPTLSARGVIPDNDDLCLYEDTGGGPHRVINRLSAEADLLLVLGCKLGHTGSGGFSLVLPRDKLIHADASADVLQANYPSRRAICCNVASLIKQLAGRLEASSSEWQLPGIRVYRDLIEAARNRQLMAAPFIGGAETGKFFDELQYSAEQTGGMIVVTDTGRHQMLVRSLWKVSEPNCLITPADYQAMGFGVPAAIGAALRRRDRKVLAVLGDGGFLVSALEILTAVRERADVVFMVFNDRSYSLIEDYQRKAGGTAFGVALPAVDYQAFSKAAGCEYVLFSAPMSGSVSRIFSRPGPAIVEVPVREKESSAGSSGMRRMRSWLKRMAA